jgi:hypothetical protein
MTNNKKRRATVAAVTRQMSTNQDASIIDEFVHGSKLAAGAFVMMFIFLSLGTVIFGW